MNRPEPDTQTNFGLLAWLEATRIALPLKGVETRFEVTAGVASVEIDQIFHQSHTEPLDCTYTFPLPAGAAVYRCEMHVNGRVIRARVEAREEAAKIFEEQRLAGRRAALVETERDNLFTLSLGNLQPQDVVVIRFAYFQTLERIGTQQRLRIPVCPGVRYIPGRPLLRSASGKGVEDDTDQVPDASRISPPRIDALHPDAAYFYAEGTLTRADVSADTLSSPTHRLLVHPGAEVFTVALAEGGAVPDRDLVVAWSEPADSALTPRAWVTESGEESYALVQLRAPALPEVAERLEQDVYFLIDRSGSMAGAKWAKTCEALRTFVRVLGEHDRVSITFFETAFQDFVEKPLPAQQILADPAFQRLHSLGVGGGTELRPAAAHVLSKVRDHSAERASMVIVITDGQVGNDAAILATFATMPQVKVHTFGIDTTVNDALLRNLAHQHGGECWLQTPHDDIAASIAQLGGRLRRPVLTELCIGDSWLPARAGMLDLYEGQVLELALFRRNGGPIEVSGRLPSGATHCFTLQPSPRAHAAIPLLWARERIATMLATQQPEAALTLAKRHNLLCEGAAFVAWDEAEQVQIAQRTIVQPAVAAILCSPSVTRFRQIEGPSLLEEAADDEIRTRMLHCSMPTQKARTKPAKKAAARRVASPAPQASRPEPDWRSTMLENCTTRGLNRALAETLINWAEAKWLTRTSRRAALESLLVALLGETSIAGKAQRCREFIATHLASEKAWAVRLLELVDDWEKELPANSTPTVE